MSIIQHTRQYTIRQVNNRYLVQNVTTSKVIKEYGSVTVNIDYDEVKHIKNSYTAGEIIGGHKVVYMYDGKVWLADKDNGDCTGRIIGMTNQSAIAEASVEVIMQGEITLNLWGLTPNAVYFLGDNGAITATIPTTGILYRIGIAKDENTLIINHNLLIERN